jgi:hypothetical protein
MSQDNENESPGKVVSLVGLLMTMIGAGLTFIGSENNPLVSGLGFIMIYVGASMMVSGFTSWVKGFGGVAAFIVVCLTFYYGGSLAFAMFSMT